MHGARELAAPGLPEHWVPKPAQSTQLVAFGTGSPGIPALSDRVQRQSWLDEVEWSVLGEWAYGQTTPRLLVEEFIGEPGSPPEDYKLLVFHGAPRLVQVDRSRFSGHTRRYYTPAWEALPHHNHIPLGPVGPPPPALVRTLAAAARLGAPFDFRRIDVYAVGDTVWFQETTPYPGAGLQTFEPRDLDRQLGDWWRLPALEG